MAKHPINWSLKKNEKEFPLPECFDFLKDEKYETKTKTVHLSPETKLVKPTKPPKKAFSKSALKKLGLLQPSPDLTYEDLHELRKLWLSYCFKILEISCGSEFQKKFEQATSIDPDGSLNKLCRIDLHGAEITVVKSKNPSCVQQSGTVIFDDKNTLRIMRKDNRIKTFIKDYCLFRVHLVNTNGRGDSLASFLIFGPHFRSTCDVRCKTKLKPKAKLAM